MASAPPRPPPHYIPNPNPNQSPNLAASLQNLQISGSGGAPPPPPATSGPISRPGQPPPGTVPRGPFTSNGAPMGPPSGPPMAPYMIRAPTAQLIPSPSPGSPPSNAQYTAPPGRPMAPFMAGPNLNPVSQPLQAGAAAQPNPVMGLAASQPNSMMGNPPSQSFPLRPFSSATQRPASSTFPDSLNQNTMGSMGSRPFPGPAPSQPYPGPPALASQPVRGPPQSFPGQPFVGQPPMGQPSMGQLHMGQPQMGLRPMAPPSMASPSIAPPPMGSASAPFSAPAWQSQQRPGGMPSGIPPVRMAPTGLGQQLMTSPPGAVMGYSPHAGAQVGTPSKIDPNQIPRPVPLSASSVVCFETRQGSVVSPPPVFFRFSSAKIISLECVSWELWSLCHSYMPNVFILIASFTEVLLWMIT